MRQLENKAVLVTGASGGIGGARPPACLLMLVRKVILSDVDPVVSQRVRDQIRAALAVPQNSCQRICQRKTVFEN